MSIPDFNIKLINKDGGQPEGYRLLVNAEDDFVSIDDAQLVLTPAQSTLFDILVTAKNPMGLMMLINMGDTDNRDLRELMGFVMEHKSQARFYVDHPVEAWLEVKPQDHTHEQKLIVDEELRRIQALAVEDMTAGTKAASKMARKPSAPRA